MPRVQEYPGTAAGPLADSIMTIAESRSVEMLGESCRRAIARLTGSPTVGLYLLDDDAPRLLCSRNVPGGFLEDYSGGMAKSDPIIDSILNGSGVVDGASFYGTHNWPKSISYDLLHAWGFAYNMCGPLRREDTIVGVFYTANRNDDSPYSLRMKQQMAMLCRAGSLALTALTRAGCLGPEPPEETSVTMKLPALPARLRSESVCRAVELPPRSAQVACLVCKGQTNKTIARHMGISDQTVKEHVSHLCRRFGVQNRTELAAALFSMMSNCP